MNPVRRTPADRADFTGRSQRVAGVCSPPRGDLARLAGCSSDTLSTDPPFDRDCSLRSNWVASVSVTSIAATRRGSERGAIGRAFRRAPGERLAAIRQPPLNMANICVDLQRMIAGSDADYGHRGGQHGVAWPRRTRLRKRGQAPVELPNLCECNSNDAHRWSD